jgi:hypothetical protein
MLYEILDLVSDRIIKDKGEKEYVVRTAYNTKKFISVDEEDTDEKIIEKVTNATDTQYLAGNLTLEHNDLDAVIYVDRKDGRPTFTLKRQQ